MADNGMETFDGCSFSGQDRRSCTLFLQLSAMKTSGSKLLGFKPTNTELPSPTVNETEVILTANVQVDGQAKTYCWQKNHSGKIAKVERKVEKGQLKVKLMKTEPDDWSDTFVDYLQNV